MTIEASRASYGSLFRVPGFGRVAAATVLARFGGAMWEIVVVLFVLQRYHSPTLAGVAVLLGLLPGLVISPIAGALLDRQGRVRLMMVDYGAMAVIMPLLASLSLAHRLPAALMLVLVALLSISNIFSVTGARSLFPLMLPRSLWDRANGLDSGSYSLTSVVGPALAGGLVAALGPEAGLIAIAVAAGAAALSLVGVREPIAPVAPPGSLMADAWAGLVYVLRHRSLRGLAVTFFLANLGYGIVPVGIPLLVLRRLHGNAATVGEVFALIGLAGLGAGLLIGRMNTEGRERQLMLACMGLQVFVLALIAVTNTIPMLFALALVDGVAGTAGNIAIFAIRQRRTDPAWFGRAFAVSFSMNVSGQPIGAAISGPLLASSISVAFLLGAAINAVALGTTFLIPRVQPAHDPKATSGMDG